MVNKSESPESKTEKEYPADFVQRVKAEFPDWKQMHEALDKGGEEVGRYLNDMSDPNGKQREDKEKTKRIEDLYHEWAEIYRAQNPDRVERDIG